MRRKPRLMSKSNRRRRMLEVLEKRLVLANYVLLDFTPDTIAGEFAVGKFVDVFTPTAINNTNKFLDYNGDSTINSDDAKIAAKRIASRVTRLLKPFSEDPAIQLVVLNTTDLESNVDPGVGERRLASGLASAIDATYVMYVGNLRPSPLVPRFGMAQQATAGNNLEHYGYAFAGEFADYFKAGDYKWKPANELKPVDFTNQVAFSIAHELGHLWGLGHLSTVDSTPSNTINPANYHHLMNAVDYANPALATFRSDATHLMEIGNGQTGTSSRIAVNAAQEVRNSLRTQNGSYVQAHYPTPQDQPLLTYKQYFGLGSELGGRRLDPTPSTSVSAPTFGPGGALLGAITLTLPTSRHDAAKEKRYRAEVLKQARRVTLAAGGDPALLDPVGT